VHNASLGTIGDGKFRADWATAIADATPARQSLNQPRTMKSNKFDPESYIQAMQSSQLPSLMARYRIGRTRAGIDEAYKEGSVIRELQVFSERTIDPVAKAIN